MIQTISLKWDKGEVSGSGKSPIIWLDGLGLILHEEAAARSLKNLAHQAEKVLSDYQENTDMDRITDIRADSFPIRADCCEHSENRPTLVFESSTDHIRFYIQDEDQLSLLEEAIAAIRQGWEDEENI